MNMVQVDKVVEGMDEHLARLVLAAMKNVPIGDTAPAQSPEPHEPSRNL